MTNPEQLQESQKFLRSLTVERLRNPEVREKFNRAAAECIRDKIRKTSFFYKVISPKPVTKEQLVDMPGNTTGKQPDMKCFMPRVQLPGTAMLMNMCGEPDPDFRDGANGLSIPMRTVTTKPVQKTHQELCAQQVSGDGILKVVEETGLSEAKERDRKFLRYCELAVKKSGQVLSENGPLECNHLRKIKHPALKNEIKPKVVLLSETAFTNSDLEDHAEKIFGMKCIYPVEAALFDNYQNDELISTDLWSFPAPEFLGCHLYSGDYQVCNKWVGADLWRFQGWEMIGAGIGNINGISKLTIKYNTM